MSVTVQQLLSKIAYDLQEADATMPSGLWTPAEMIGYINYAVGCFFNDTGVLVSDNSITATLTDRSYSFPSDAGYIKRISFDGSRTRRISLSDMASRNTSWRSMSGIPKFYHEDGLPIRTFEFDKTPSKAGTIRIFADYLPLDVDSTDDTIPIPDIWIPAIQWEVISFALQKDGESQDLARAAWAHEKYKFYVSTANRIIGNQDV